MLWSPRLRCPCIVPHTSVQLLSLESLLQHDCLTWSPGGTLFHFGSFSNRTKHFVFCLSNTSSTMMNLSLKRVKRRFDDFHEVVNTWVNAVLTVAVGLRVRTVGQRCVSSRAQRCRWRCLKYLLRYSNKNRNFGRVFALLTEKRQNVCSRRVESVWMGEGGRFGRGCGAAKS